MNILTPVDFSKCAGNALKYASHLAEMTQSKLHLHHVFTDDDEVMDKAKANELKKSLAVFYTGYGNKYPNIEVGVQVSPDITGLAFNPLIKEIDLIIMGTKGATGLKSVLVGSNTVRLMDATTRPVLVVPEEAGAPQKGKPILFLTDYAPTENMHVFDPLIEIANAMGSEVILLHVKHNGEHYEMFQLVEKSRLETYLCEKTQCRQEVEFNGDVVAGVNEYIRQHDVQMMVMVHHDHSMLENVFKRNHTHEMAFHTELPLLVLNKRDVYHHN